MKYKLLNVKHLKLLLNIALFTAASVCIVWLLFVNTQIKYYLRIPTNVSTSLEYITPGEINLSEQLTDFIINTPGCKIPNMDPFDKSIQEFIIAPKPIICNNGIPPLFESFDSTVVMKSSSLEFYNITDISKLNCCYHSLWRVNPQSKNNRDDNIVFHEKCFKLINYQNITNEFIKVVCLYDNQTIYTDFFSFVPIKNISAVKERKKMLNVLIIGLDAVSRLNLHRQMPETVNYLQSIGTIELLGYNKVGDNTFPNVIPMLSGMFEAELKNSCWTHNYDRFDNCSFIWNKYKENNYVTAFGEDASWMGIFSYQRFGFRHQPTDYDYSYFNKISEKQSGNSHNLNVYECEGGREVYRDFLDYIQKFTYKMDQENLNYFGFFWGSSLSHDFLNKPRLGDTFYKDFFQNLKSTERLNNTILFFVSDHGIRWGDIRQTFQGRMEERLPFVMITLPLWFKKQYSEHYNNLLSNTKKLTSPFDIHETLKYIASSQLNNKKFSGKSRGISLFSEIPTDRTCKDAGITSHWCSCQESFEIDPNSTMVYEASSYAVNYINQQLEGYLQCSRITLHAVLNARLLVYGDGVEKSNNDFTEYLITIRTQPGDAIFETTIRRNSNLVFEVIGSISRLNLYGKQSSCVSDFHLKLYCYCK